MTVLTFDEALQRAGEKRHLLLGNGFSIALRPNIFCYGSLFEKADFSGFPGVEATFRALGSEDFEEAVQALEGAATVLPGFLADSQDVCTSMNACAAKIKNVLVSTIAGQHPSRPNEILESQYLACLNFLKKFLSGPKGGKVYTLNYDILLYWTLMHGWEKGLIDFDDGFRFDAYNEGAEYVVWDDSAHKQNVFYLHGALHLFDGGHELQKYTWCRTDSPLVDQAREAIRRNLFPLFVAEGTWEKKLSKIEHHGYLSRGLRSFSNINYSLFIHGLSLADNDTHILRAIGRNTKLEAIFIGLHGDPAAGWNQQIVRRAQAIAARRDAKHPLAVHFYDSGSANVWGATT